MKKETFINYNNWRYAWVSLIFCLSAILAYCLNDPYAGSRGNTILGYFLGIYGASVILYLAYFGIRKRAYLNGEGALVERLSKHTWLGLTLLLIIPLHSGFSFGYNVHSMLFYIMVLVVVSGIIGAIFYRYYPKYLLSQRGGSKFSEIIKDIEKIDIEIESLVKENEILRPLLSGIDINIKGLREGNFYLVKKSVSEKIVLDKLTHLDNQNSLKAVELVNLVSKKFKFINQIVVEARAKVLLRAWLFFHIPLTFVLLVLLFVHIFCALYYYT